MSVGNINSYGDKKNNFSFQYKVLKGIADIFASVSGSSININPKVVRAGMYRELTEIEVTDLSSVLGTSTVRSITFANLGLPILIKIGSGFQQLATGEIVSFDAGTLNNTFNTSEMGYNTVGGTTAVNLLITYTY